MTDNDTDENTYHVKPSGFLFLGLAVLAILGILSAMHYVEISFLVIGSLALVMVAIAVVASAVKIVRPTQRALVERLGKYHRFGESGFQFVIPILERIVFVNVTEQMVNAIPQDIITKDRLNARVDAQIYFKVKSDEANTKASQYNVNNYNNQIVSLAWTTLRNIMGTMSLKEANSERNKINTYLQEVLKKETTNWGIEVVRTELKEIDPPKDVQETMNSVIKAENEKIAAVDFATAAETNADGLRRAAIKAAEGARQANILQAEGQAEAIRLVNEAAEKYFIGNAQLLKQLEVVQNALKENTTFVVPAGSSLVNVIGNLSGLDGKAPLPLPTKQR